MEELMRRAVERCVLEGVDERVPGQVLGWVFLNCKYPAGAEFHLAELLRCRLAMERAARGSVAVQE